MLWRPVWDSLSPLLPKVLSGLTSNPWYFRALEIHLYKTWTKKGRKPGGHELPLVRQMTCSFINETITLEGGSKHIPSSLYNPQFSQAIPFNWAMTMEYLIVAWKFEEATSSESMFASGLLQSNISPACGKCCLIYATYGALWAVLLLFSKGLSLLIFLQTEMCSYLHLFKALPFVLHPGNSIFCLLVLISWYPKHSRCVKSFSFLWLRGVSQLMRNWHRFTRDSVSHLLNCFVTYSTKPVHNI